MPIVKRVLVSGLVAALLALAAIAVHRSGVSLVGTSAALAAVPAGTAAAPPAPPAPPDFRAELISSYQHALDAYAALAAQGAKHAPSLPSPGLDASAFAAQVNALSDAQVNEIYAGAPQQWQRYFAAVPILAAAVAKPAVAKPATSLAPSAVKPADAQLGDSFDGAFEDPNIAVCPTPPPGQDPAQDGFDTLNIEQLTLDSATIAASVLPHDFTVVIAGEGTTIVDPAYLASVAIQDIAQFAVDTTQYEINIFAACLADNQDVFSTDMYALLVGLDNRTAATHLLLGSRTSQIIQGISTVQSSLNTQLRTSIESALGSSGGATVISYELPASLGGYLDSTPIGVQSIVTDDLANLQKAGQPISAAAPTVLNAANRALAGGHYKQAYALYQSAYHDLVTPAG